MTDAHLPQPAVSANGQPPSSEGVAAMHPAWRSFVQYCERLGHGEIEQLKIQNGLPVMAELTTKKVNFAP